MKRFLLFLFLSAGFAATAQDVTGIWRGSFHGQQSKLMKMLGEEDRYKFELQIEQNAKAFEGVTYSYKTTIFYGKATCRGTVNPKTKKVLLEELKLVEVRMSQGTSACVMTCHLQYSRNGDEEFMEGTYSSWNEADSTNCGGGTIFLRKVATSDFYKEPFLVARENEALKKASAKKSTAPTKTPARKPAAASAVPPAKPSANKPATGSTARAGSPAKPATRPPARSTTTSPAKKPAGVAKAPADAKKSSTPEAKKQPAAENKITFEKPQASEVEGPVAEKKRIPIPKVLASRENELVKTIYAPAGQISINIYDNGSVDNDTISVFLNKKMVLSKRRLTEKAITLNFDVNDEQEEHELVMVAENLGEIPPNTSLMVVTAGEKKYEVRITSTEQKNAVIVFKLQKK
jgi:hypothetical protein